MIVNPVIRYMLLIGVFLVSACTVKLESARLNSPDLTFTALDGSFKVSPGESFTIPQNTPFCYDNSSSSIGSIFKAKTPIAAQAKVGKEHGGLVVRIDITGEPKPLYGLLLFCSKPSSAVEFSSLSKHENIEIPERFRAIARSGQVVSVLRVYKFKIYGEEIMRFFFIGTLAGGQARETELIALRLLFRRNLRP